MGNSLEKALMNPPFTFQQCFVNDELDLARYLIYCWRINEINDAMSAAHQIYSNIQEQKKRKFDSMEVKSSKRTCIRTVKKHRILVRENDGSLREVKPQDTLWYLLYVRQPPRNKRLAALFRRRFRLPYGSFCSYWMILGIIPHSESIQVGIVLEKSQQTYLFYC